MKKILVIAAHPDDESLGCGGTILRHAEEGDRVEVIFLADGVSSRDQNAIDLAPRWEACKQAMEILGVAAYHSLGFADNQLDSLPMLEIVQTLETTAFSFDPEIVYTHFSGDLNIDHMISAQATMTAFRPQPHCNVKAIYGYEVLSSTGWAASSAKNHFAPQCYIDISPFLAAKLRALKCYGEEMREYPHARSIESVEHLARFRGSSVGLAAAEAFMVERLIK